MKFLVFLGIAVWLTTSVAGVGYLARYKNMPAAVNNSYPLIFPPESRLERDAASAQSTLIFFSHPKCPCTRASLRELSRLTTRLDGKLKVYVVFNKPENADEDWTKTDLRASAEAIPNVTVLIDENERETNIFGAETSGLVLLYDRDGNLRFDGGITASRGHEGDNAGSSAIFEIITKETEKTAETAVFGCPLYKKDCQGEQITYAQ